MDFSTIFGRLQELDTLNRGLKNHCSHIETQAKDTRKENATRANID